MSKGLVFIDALEFEGDGVLPEGAAIGLVKLEGMLGIVRDFDSKHELDPIDASFISVHHGSHSLVILEEFGSPLPCAVLGQSLLDGIGN